MTDKIESQHLERKAILYVRQSSSFQVQHNEESRKLQYAMQQRLHGLGWEQIDVIDEDLGRSAAGGVVRSGFERMVADVCLGKVGAVAAREVSRFARNSRDWQKLVEVCRVVDTLLIDQEAIYAPRQSNDRLLLGLKGSLNEYELDLLRQRSVEARYEKAKRGELIVAAPVGYVKTGTARGGDLRLEKDPNAQVREAVELAFSKCFELGSVRQALMWLIEEGLQLPVRDDRGDLSWKRPNYAMLYQIVTNPTYGGAYAYGRTEYKSHYQDGSMARKSRRKPQDEWIALIPENHEGYLSWDDFRRLQEMIASNNLHQGKGAARSGSALLAGLLHCRRCARRLVVAYTGINHDAPRYCCHRGNLDNGEAKCISFGGVPVDRAVTEQVFRVLAPAAIEAAVLAHQQQSEQRDQVLRALERDLEAARYEAARAQRQFDAADPENRLVTAELERRWNAALERVAEVESRISRHHQKNVDDEADIGEFAQLAADVEAVWNDAADIRRKKRIVRALIEDIIADLDSKASEVVLTIHWAGGLHTELRVPRRRRGAATATPISTVEAIRVLARICPDDAIAGFLNRNGLLTGRGNRWTRGRVTSMRKYHEIACYCRQAQEDQGWMNLTEAAEVLNISTRTLRLAIERGDIVAEHPLPDGPWVINREQLQTASAQAVVQQTKQRQGTPAVPTPNQKTLAFPSE